MLKSKSTRTWVRTFSICRPKTWNPVPVRHIVCIRMTRRSQSSYTLPPMMILYRARFLTECRRCRSKEDKWRSLDLGSIQAKTVWKWLRIRLQTCKALEGRTSYSKLAQAILLWAISQWVRGKISLGVCTQISFWIWMGLKSKRSKKSHVKHQSTNSRR